jgi:hypothetical protein
MKQVLLVLALLTAFPAMAQQQVLTPTAPVIPSVATVSPNAASALAISTTNRVFVDQSGENPNVNITQTGTGNTVGADTTYTKALTGIPNRLGTPTTRAWTLSSPIYLRGADQTIVTVQTGNNNTIGLRAENPTTAGDGVNVTIQQIGNSNVVDAACGGGTASDGTTALTGCKDAVLNWKFAGNTNVMQFRGTGDNLNSNVDAAGNSNEFYIDAIGNNQSQTIKVVGDFNVFNVSQTSTGAAGSSAWIDVTGSTNRFTINQSGTVDSVVNIKSVASTGTWNINQKTQ